MKCAKELFHLISRVAGEVIGYLNDLFCDLGLEQKTIKSHEYDEDVTISIDLEAERIVKELLEVEGFDGCILSEESGYYCIGDSSIVAIVDPLDGSRNYVSCIPLYAISIALYDQHTKLPLAGVIAGSNGIKAGFVKGGGAYLNTVRLEELLSRILEPRIALLYLESPCHLRLLDYLKSYRVGVRSLGCASIEAVLAATGLSLGFIDFRKHLRNVDLAAAIGFALEAGAHVALGVKELPLSRVEKIGPVIVTRNTKLFDYAMKLCAYCGLDVYRVSVS